MFLIVDVCKEILRPYSLTNEMSTRQDDHAMTTVAMALTIQVPRISMTFWMTSSGPRRKYEAQKTWETLENMSTSQWRHNRRGDVSNHQPYECLLNLLFRRRSKKTSKRRVTGLCVGNSPVTGELPAQRANNAENGSIWWRHLELFIYLCARYWSSTSRCHNICRSTVMDKCGFRIYTGQVP